MANISLENNTHFLVVAKKVEVNTYLSKWSWGKSELN